MPDPKSQYVCDQSDIIGMFVVGTVRAVLKAHTCLFVCRYGYHAFIYVALLYQQPSTDTRANVL